MKIQIPCVDLCTGFMQSTRKTNGMDVLADKLHSINGLRVGRPMKWDSDPIGNAKWVLDNIDHDASYSIVAYSYGANTALTMCRELHKHRRGVDRLYLIDGVKRLRTARFSWIAKAWSINPYLKLVVPNNVNNCLAWRQSVGRPKGHKILQQSILGTKFTTINADFLKVKHVDMEDQAVIHEKIFDQLRLAA